MPVLLDSHIFLWLITDNPRLNSDIKNFIDEQELVFVSTVSLWELALKAQAGKLNFSSAVIGSLESNGFIPLTLKPEHIMQLYELPPIHKDPFDRILTAQAIVEDLTLITIDKEIAKYNVKCYAIKDKEQGQ